MEIMKKITPIYGVLTPEELLKDNGEEAYVIGEIIESEDKITII